MKHLFIYHFCTIAFHGQRQMYHDGLFYSDEPIDKDKLDNLRDGARAEYLKIEPEYEGRPTITSLTLVSTGQVETKDES